MSRFPRFPARAAVVPAALALLAGVLLPARAAAEWVPVEMSPGNWEVGPGVSVEHLGPSTVHVGTETGQTGAAWLDLKGALANAGPDPFGGDPILGTIAFDFYLPPTDRLEHQTGFQAGSAAMTQRTHWNGVGGPDRFQTANTYPQNLVKAGDWGSDLLNPTLNGVWYNMWLVSDLQAGEFSLYARRADAGGEAPVHRGTWSYSGVNAEEDFSALEYFAIGAGGIAEPPDGYTAADALGGVYANIHTYAGPEPNLTLTPGSIQVGEAEWEVVDTFAGGVPAAAWGGDLDDMVLDFSGGYLDLRSDVQLSIFHRPFQSRSIFVELPESVASAPVFTVTVDLNITGPEEEANFFGFGIVGDDRIGLDGYARRGDDDQFGVFGGGGGNLVKRRDSGVILPSSARDEWYQVWLVYNTASNTVDVYAAPDGEGAPASPTQSYSLAHAHGNFRYLVLGHDTSEHPGVKFGNIHFAPAELLTLSPTAGEFVPEEPPKIIFITENRSAEAAAQSVVEREYNAAQREALRETDFAAWENYSEIEWRDLPVAFREARLAEILGELGLAPDDPADRRFTDFLEARGYEVRRSWTEVEEDPVTGAVAVTHEFWGAIGEPFTATGDYRLSQEQIDRLEAADLVIMSPDLTPGSYSWGGREGGQASTALIEQWNGLSVPVVAMNARLIQTNEFGSWGWGWSYGFSATYDTITAFDRIDVSEDEAERFVFPDWRPRVLSPDSPLLAGLPTADGDRIAIYKDYESFPVLPRTPLKFSNNNNYSYPANARVLLELDVPSFFAAGMEIETRDPVLLDIDAGIRFFQPAGMPSERVGTPAGRRIYLAAGLADTGLYNLSTAGEQLFLNIVEALAGPGLPPDFAILAHPQNLTVAAGEEAVFAVEAEGSAEMTYRWQASFDGGETYSNLSDGSLFAGTDTATLTVPEATAMLDGLRVRAVVSDGSSSVTSEPAVLSVVSSTVPAITAHPQPVSAQAGGEAVFTAAADGVPAPVLRWQLSTDGGEAFADLAEGGPYSGVDTAELTVAPLTLDMDGHRFRAVAENSEGSATSAAAVLTVTPVPVAPVFTAQPENRSVREGLAAVFSAPAEGYPAPAYQWQLSFDEGESFSNITDASFGGGVFSGTQTPELTLLSADAFLDGALFRARAANSEGEAFSAAARLTTFIALNLDEWLDAAGVPTDARGPADRHGPLGLTNLEAYGTGLSPFAAAPADLPRMERAADGSGVLRFHYSVNTRAVDVSVSIEGSTDLAEWTAAEPQEESVLWESDGVEGREAVFGAGDGVLFLRLRVDDRADAMVLVKGGTLPPLSEIGELSVDTFYIGRFEVTWGEWQEVRSWGEGNGFAWSSFAGGGCAEDFPVYSVSWYDAVKWCNAKSEMEGLTPVYTVDGEVYRSGEFGDSSHLIHLNPDADGYRLPTEEEWEFAARGGNQSSGYTYSGGNDIDAVAWYFGNATGAPCPGYNDLGTRPIGEKVPNELGLYDMSGNVAEWCWDESNGNRVVRGGSHMHGANWAEVISRQTFQPDRRIASTPGRDLGFRLVRTPSP